MTASGFPDALESFDREVGGERAGHNRDQQRHPAPRGSDLVRLVDKVDLDEGEKPRGDDAAEHREMTQARCDRTEGPPIDELKPTAAIPAPITPPTTACVVDTGAPTTVARLTQSAAETSAAIIAQTNVLVSATCEGSMIPLEIVATTSPPASSAPALSKLQR